MNTPMDKAHTWTPGPWEVDAAGDIVAGSNLIAISCGDDYAQYRNAPDGGAAEFDANARLIAAAPELLEAAQDAVEGFKTLRIGLRDNKAAIECIDAHIDELNYAIAGATGIPT